MRTWVLWLFAAACEPAMESTDADCPSAASVQVVELGTGTLQRTCRWDDRRTIVETDARGKIVGRTSFQAGKLDGLQIAHDPYRGIRMESMYRRGLLDGPVRHFKDGELEYECFYIDGLRDGFCWSASMGIEQYDRGKRTGLWSFGFEGTMGSTRVYGDDILLALDGRSVPLPPASIEVDGKVVWRTQCPRTKATDRCRLLFDDYQLCELDPADRDDCRERARAGYRQARPSRGL